MYSRSSYSALFCSSYNTRAKYTLILCTCARPSALFCSSYVLALILVPYSARPSVNSTLPRSSARPTILKLVLHPLSLFLLFFFFSSSLLVKKLRSLCKHNIQYVQNVHIFICHILGRSTIVYLKKRKHNLFAM
jgi:hypothetical protein